MSKYHQEGQGQQSPEELANPFVQCPLITCAAKTYSRKKCIAHIRGHLKEGKEVKCPFCPSKCSKPDQFSVHMSRFHPVDITFEQLSSGVKPLSGGSEDFSEEAGLNAESGDDHHLENNNQEDDPPNEIFLPENVIKDEIARFYLKLEGLHLLPTLIVQDIAEEVKFITELVHHSLKNALKEELNNIGLEENIIESVTKKTFMCDPVYNVHHKGEAQKHFGSAHLRSVFWQRRFPYVEPQRFPFGVDGNGKKKVAHYISIRDTLQVLLKDPDIKQKVVDSFNRENNNSEILSDYTDGSAYIEHKKQHEMESVCSCYYFKMLLNSIHSGLELVFISQLASTIPWETFLLNIDPKLT